MFENLVHDVSTRTGLGEVRANDVIRAVVARLLHNPHGGFAPILVTFRDAGHADTIAQWLGDDPKAGAISPDEAEAILGAEWVDETSRALGISRDEVRLGGAVALPSVVHEMTPGGLIPAADELERGYAGWAGGHVSMAEAPIAGFPTDPSPVSPDVRRVEMDLSLPAPEIKAKAFDGVGTLLPWFALFIALPIVLVTTALAHPAEAAAHGSHGGAHATEHGAEHAGGAAHGETGPGVGQGEVSHGEGATSEVDVPGSVERSPAETARESTGAEPNAHGDAGPGAGNAAAGNTAEVPAGNAPIQASPSEVPTPGQVRGGTGETDAPGMSAPGTPAPTGNAPADVPVTNAP